MSLPLAASGLLSSPTNFLASRRISMMLLRRANRGASGKDATNRVTKPNWITAGMNSDNYCRNIRNSPSSHCIQLRLHHKLITAHEPVSLVIAGPVLVLNKNWEKSCTILSQWNTHEKEKWWRVSLVGCFGFCTDTHSSPCTRAWGQRRAPGNDPSHNAVTSSHVPLPGKSVSWI